MCLILELSVEVACAKHTPNPSVYTGCVNIDKYYI